MQITEQLSYLQVYQIPLMFSSLVLNMQLHPFHHFYIVSSILPCCILNVYSTLTFPASELLPPVPFTISPLKPITSSFLHMVVHILIYMSFNLKGNTAFTPVSFPFLFSLWSWLPIFSCPLCSLFGLQCFHFLESTFHMQSFSHYPYWMVSSTHLSYSFLDGNDHWYFHCQVFTLVLLPYSLSAHFHHCLLEEIDQVGMWTIFHTLSPSAGHSFFVVIWIASGHHSGGVKFFFLFPLMLHWITLSDKWCLLGYSYPKICTVVIKAWYSTQLWDMFHKMQEVVSLMC